MTVDATGLNSSLHDWPPPSTRYPLHNYDGGFLMFRNYGAVGSAVSFAFNISQTRCRVLDIFGNLLILGQ